MCSQVRDTTDGIALNFDVRGHHLPDERGESAELDNGDLVLGWEVSAIDEEDRLIRTNH